MAKIIVTRQVVANPISAPSFTSPAPSAVLEVATTVVISGTCDAACTYVEVLANGEVVATATPSAGSFTCAWSPGQLRAGQQRLTVRTYRGNSYAQTSRDVTVSGTPLASKWDLGFWHADDLANQYSDGQAVTSWSPRTGAQPWTAALSHAPTYQAAGYGNAWPGVGPGANKGCVLLNGTSQYLLCDALVAAFTAANARSVFIIYQQVSAAGTQTLICASATTGTANKWQLFSNSAPGAYRILRGTTTSVYGTNPNQRNDLGAHFVFVRDPGTGPISLHRDVLWTPGTQSVANAAVTANTSTKLALGANFNGSTTPTNYGNIKILCVGLSTQAFTTQEQQKCAYQALGLFDRDQYYGDSATAFKLNPGAGQSNLQGLAVSSLPALPQIRLLAISTNNWIADMPTTVPIGPQQGNLGPWYQFAQDRRTATGQDVHICLAGQGATGINSFKDPAYDGLYSTALFDLQCRVIAEAKAALGGTPDIDRFLIVEGETDSQSSPGSSTYQANMTTWANNIRTLIPGCSASTRIVAPQVSSYSAYPFGAAVQAAQAAWAAADVNGAAPSVASIASAPFFNLDGIHYNQAGVLGLGSIAAAA